MLICSSYEATRTPNAWSAAQAVAASLQPRSSRPEVAAATVQQPQQERQPQRPAVRRIVFHTRGTQVRQFKNLPELLRRCSKLSWSLPAASAAAAAANGRSQAAAVECSTHSFSNLTDSVAAAQAADVFVGTHGANLANGRRMDACRQAAAMFAYWAGRPLPLTHMRMQRCPPSLPACHSPLQASSCARAAPWWK